MGGGEGDGKNLKGRFGEKIGNHMEAVQKNLQDLQKSCDKNETDL